MKLIAIILGLAAVVSAITQVPYQIPPEKLAKVQKISATCAQEHNVDPGLLKMIPDGTLPRDEASNKYFNCVTLTLGLTKEDGHMVVDKMASMLEDHPLVETFKESIRKCNEVTKENPLATLIEMNNCIVTTAPVRFLL